MFDDFDDNGWLEGFLDGLSWAVLFDDSDYTRRGQFPWFSLLLVVVLVVCLVMVVM